MKGRELDQIDTYLLGEMAAEEARLFEQQLLIDSELKTSVDIRKLIHSEVKETYNAELKEKLHKYDKIIDRKNSLSRTIKIAATVLIIIIGGFSAYQFSYKPNLSAYDFYEEGINNYMNDDAQKVQFNNAMSKFRSENYTASITEFEKLLVVKPTNDTLNYYLGVSYFREGEFDKTIQSMKKVVLNTSSTFYQKAEFRLALSYYANDGKISAKTIFNAIAKDETNEFAMEANEILKKY